MRQVRRAAEDPIAISRRSFLGAGVGLVAVLVVSCGDDDGEQGSAGRSLGTESDPVRRFTIVAENLRWDLERIVVPAAVDIDATVDNRDDGIGHNLHILLDGDEPKTPVANGPVQQRLRFRVRQPGTYRFVCDPHAATMEGEIIAI